MKRYSTGESFGRIIITFVGCLIMIPASDLNPPWSVIVIAAIAAFVIFFPKITEYIGELNDKLERKSKERESEDYDE